MQRDYSDLQDTGPHTAGELDLVPHGLKKSNKNIRFRECDQSEIAQIIRLVLPEALKGCLVFTSM